MRFSVAIVALSAAAASAYSYGNTTDYTTTEIVTDYTTYCPGPTTIVEGSQTITVSSAMTVTVTNCPCTITKTYTSAPTAEKPTTAPTLKPTGEKPTGEEPVAPAPTGTGVPPSYGNDTTAVPTVPSTAPPSPSSTDGLEGAANRATVAGGVLAGLLGAVAYLL